MLNSCTEHPPEEGLQHVGVAIKRVDVDQNHVGILYRNGHEVRFSHLAWHHDLKDERYRSDYLWAACGLFIDDEINGQVFAGRMLNIARSGGFIPYGFHSEGNAFSNAGQFISFPDPAMGLTCATYVIQVFQSFGFPIADLATWESRDGDVIWQEKILSILAKYTSESRALEAAIYAGNFRVKPEEAAAAVIHPSPPLVYKEALTMAIEIQREVEEARRSSQSSA